MSALSSIQGGLFVNGSLVATSFSAPAGSIDNAAIKAGAPGNYVGATKLEQLFQRDLALCDHATAASATRRVTHRVRGASGTLVSFGVGATQAAGASSSITVDLKKNGTTVLSATITLDNTTAAFTLKSASGFSSTALAAGDVLEADITAVSGANLPRGVYVQLALREEPQ